MTEADHEREAAETVEKVLRHRVGRKGGLFPVSQSHQSLTDYIYVYYCISVL